MPADLSGAASHPGVAVRPVVYETCPRCKRAIGLLADGTLKPHKVWTRPCEPPVAEPHPAVAASAGETTDEGKTAAVLRWADANLPPRLPASGAGAWLATQADEIDPKEGDDAPR